MKTQIYNPHRFCVAPMLHCTDRHFRYLARLMTKHTMLYTEMITPGSLIYGNRDRALQLNLKEHPIALQLGGSNPDELSKCAEFANTYSYDEINLNIGCPSNRVQAGKFGACLMLEPDAVARCIKSIKALSDLEVTIKTRIGVDDHDDYDKLSYFINIIANAGCETIIVHARKAYLSGLSPKENRTIPPLRYDYVYRLKEDYPNLNIIINGGINNMTDVQNHLKILDGVMVGREAYENPYFLAFIDSCIFNEDSENQLSRFQILESYITYIQQQLDEGVPLKTFIRHIFGLFSGIQGAKAWRRYLSENIYKRGAGVEVIMDAAKFISRDNDIALAS